MKLYQQLVLFMLAATVLPLALVGFWLLRASEDELVSRIGGEQRALGVLAARDASTRLMGAVEALGRAVESFDWGQVSQEEARGGLTLLYRQSSLVAATVMVDADAAVLAGPIHGAGDDGHPKFANKGLQTLLTAVPLGPLRGGEHGQAALSPAYGAFLEGEAARFSVALKGGAGPDAPFLLAELGLDEVEAELRARAYEERGRIELVDGGGRIIASSDPRRRLVPVEADLWARAQSELASGNERSFVAKGEGRILVSAVKVPDQLGLIAIVSQDEARALAPVLRMRRTVLVAIGVATAVLLVFGGLYTRRLNRRIRGVVQGAQAYGRGDLAFRVPVSGSDELAELGATFNTLGAELEAARTKLLGWNDELRQRVEEATAELRAAQAQLLEAQKLAAVGQLGAGVAHEINNPLAGILGNTQLMMLDRDEKDPDFDTLRKIELSAKRCKEITQSLLRFSQQRDKPELRPLELGRVVREALNLTEHQLQGEGITLDCQLASGGLQVNADPGHLQQVLLAVVSNARTAMLKSARKALVVRTLVEDGEAVVVIEDTGKGIKPEYLPRIFEPFFTTKDVWSNVGLGLSVAYRVVTEHQGRIDVRSEVGKGTAVTLRLPLWAAGRGPASGNAAA